MQIIQRDQLALHASRMGALLQERLTSLKADHSCIAEVRGKGLMLGVEIVAPGKKDTLGHPLADTEQANRIQRSALKRGLIIEKGGRHGAVLRFLPPLNITEEQIDFAANSFAQAVKDNRSAV